MHLFVIPPWINHIVFVAVSLAAIWWGDWRGRVMASVQLALYPLSDVVCAFADPCVHVPWRALLFDGLLCLACLVCLVGARRYWVVWATTCAALAMLADASGYAPGVSLWTWASATLGSSYLLNVALAWGVWTTVRGRAVDELRPQPE